MLDEDEGSAHQNPLIVLEFAEFTQRLNKRGFALTNPLADPQASADSDVAMKELYKGIRELWPRVRAVLLFCSGSHSIGLGNVRTRRI